MLLFTVIILLPIVLILTIFGTKGRAILKEKGKFMCPECYLQTTYQYYKVTHCFSLLSIPIFPYKHGDDFIKCEQCKKEFKTEVLDYNSEDMIKHEITLHSLYNCPLHVIQRILTDKGYDNRTVINTINQVKENSGFLLCSTCNSEYYDIVPIYDKQLCSTCNCEIDCVMYPTNPKMD